MLLNFLEADNFSIFEEGGELFSVYLQNKSYVQKSQLIMYKKKQKQKLCVIVQEHENNKALLRLTTFTQS